MSPAFWKKKNERQSFTKKDTHHKKGFLPNENDFVETLSRPCGDFVETLWRLCRDLVETLSRRYGDFIRTLQQQETMNRQEREEAKERCVEWIRKRVRKEIPERTQRRQKRKYIEIETKEEKKESNEESKEEQDGSSDDSSNPPTPKPETEEMQHLLAAQKRKYLTAAEKREYGTQYLTADEIEEMTPQKDLTEKDLTEKEERDRKTACWDLIRYIFRTWGYSDMESGFDEFHFLIREDHDGADMDVKYRGESFSRSTCVFDHLYLLVTFLCRIPGYPDIEDLDDCYLIECSRKDHLLTISKGYCLHETTHQFAI